MIDGAQREIAIISQWAIDGVGKSKDIFNSLKNAVRRNVNLRLLYNTHSDAILDSGYSPNDLVTYENSQEQVSRIKGSLLILDEV